MVVCEEQTVPYDKREAGWLSFLFVRWEAIQPHHTPPPRLPFVDHRLQTFGLDATTGNKNKKTIPLTEDRDC